MTAAVSHRVLRSEEATDAAGLPAGVSHEGPRGDTHPPPGPVLTPRVFIMTAGLHPATGPGTAPLHQVEHLPAGNLGKLILLVTDEEMFVKSAASILPPPGTQLSLVLHSPGSSRLGEPRRLSLYLRLGDVLWRTADLQETQLGIKPTGIAQLRGGGRVQGVTLGEGHTLGPGHFTAVLIRHLRVKKSNY